MFYFVPQTSSRVDSAGNAGDPYSNAIYSAHTGMAAQGLPSCVVGVGCVVTPFLAKNLYDLFYNDGLFDQSKGTITINAGVGRFTTLSANGTYSDLATSVTLSSASLAKATDGSLRNVILKISGFSSTNPGKLTGPDGNEQDTESFLASLKVVSTAQLFDQDSAEIVVIIVVVMEKLM